MQFSPVKVCNSNPVLTIPGVYSPVPPRIPALTIHDSFIVLTANATVVERIMSEELITYTGYPPVIRREQAM